MVLMTVSNKYRFHLISVFNEIAEIRDHNIDPRHCFIRKGHACIYYDNFVAITESSHILPNFPQTSQGNNL